MKAEALAQTIPRRVLNTLLPARCSGCGVFIEDPGNLCSKCWSDIDFITEPACTRCYFPFEYAGGEGSLCGSCVEELPPYDKAKAVFKYNDKSKRLITQFKYGDRIHMARTYGHWMTRVAEDLLTETDIITPVPLHRIRLFTRRYNQAAILAHVIAKYSDVNVMPDLLMRMKHSTPQTSLPKSQRFRNVKGIFKPNPKCSESVEGKNVLLVDDVMTTGATIKECTKVLKKAGAKKVFVITLARTAGEG